MGWFTKIVFIGLLLTLRPGIGRGETDLHPSKSRDVSLGNRRNEAPSSRSEISLTTTDWTSRMRRGLAQWLDAMSYATRRSAVALIGPVQKMGGTKLVPILGNRMDHWVETVRLMQERRGLIRALAEGGEARDSFAVAMAQRHVVPMPPAWIDSLRSQRLFGASFQGAGMPSAGLRRKMKAVCSVEGKPVTVRMFVSDAVVLYERWFEGSPYQIATVPEGFDVYVQQPVLASPMGLLPSVFRSLERDIRRRVLGSPAGGPSGQGVDALLIQRGMLEQALQGDLNRWTNLILTDPSLRSPGLVVPERSRFAVWKVRPEGEIDFLHGPGRPLSEVTVNNVGMSVLMEAPPCTVSPSMGLMPMDADFLARHFLAQGRERTASLRDAEVLVKERLSRTIEGLTLFQKAVHQRGALLGLSWRVDRAALMETTADLVVSAVRNAGRQQGQRSALSGERPDDSAVASLTDQFPSLGLTMAGVVRMGGGRWDDHEESLNEFLAEAARIYLREFDAGYRELDGIGLSFASGAIDDRRGEERVKRLVQQRGQIR